MARYVAMLRRNSLRHSIDIGDVSFSDNGPQYRDLTDLEAAEIRRRIDAASSPTGKCPGIKTSIIFLAEADLKGRTIDEYLLLTKPLTRKQKAAKEAAEKAKEKVTKDKKE